VTGQDGGPEEPRITVEAEDSPERLLLETRISKEDGFQKQQGIRDVRAVATNIANLLFRYFDSMDRTNKWYRYGT
jgi:protein phosphatase 4 regulatory subunit 3